MTSTFHGVTYRSFASLRTTKVRIPAFQDVPELSYEYHCTVGKRKGEADTLSER